MHYLRRIFISLHLQLKRIKHKGWSFFTIGSFSFFLFGDKFPLWSVQLQIGSIVCLFIVYFFLGGGICYQYHTCLSCQFKLIIFAFLSVFLAFFYVGYGGGVGGCEREREG